ncbi:MAG: hypothetical protein KGI50_02090 [Patescibacteria group bacterium]|nr:hypothetical protein [Patescibacteria group bacterium]MDE2437864.1 hypothetical protein [Patescibacteria group bacterium]
MLPSINLARKILFACSCTLLLITLPFLASAQGLVPCNGGNCGLCDFGVLLNNIYLFLLTWSPVVAILRIAYAGVLMIVYSSNTGKINEARTMIWSTLKWLVIIYCSFVIVNTVVRFLAGGSNIEGTWYKFSCTASQPLNIGLNQNVQSIGLSTRESAVWVPSSASSQQTYKPSSTGFCSVDYLKQFFTHNVELAACVCNAESGGNPNISPPNPNDQYLSTAYCGGYNNPSKYGYTTPQSTVFGLGQINIAANSIGGLNCPAAFDNYVGKGASTPLGKRDACTIKDKALYEQCVQAAKDPVTNLKKFAEMSGNGANWKPWDSITLFGACKGVPRS